MSDAGSQAPVSNTPPAPQGNYGWIFYFAFLIVASVGVTAWMIYFNLSIQLTPDQVEAAQKRWQEKGPSDYKLVFTKRIDDDPKPIIFAVTVADGKVIDAKKEGKAFEPDFNPSMTGLLTYVQQNLETDAKPGAKKVYTIARFDEKTGAMLYYVRRVMGTTNREEIDVKANWMER